MNFESFADPVSVHGAWMPWIQAATLGLATFVQEDIPTISAALLAAAGRIPTGAAFLGCFLGIWIGDVLLYLAARALGRPLLDRSWARSWATPDAIARSEDWFARCGTWLLVTSRFVPGTRLPTYLAAGFLRLPLPRFLAVTGAAVALWTLILFGLAHQFGPGLRDTLEQRRLNPGFVLGGVLAAFLIVKIIQTLTNPALRRRLATRIARCRRWEFWPAWLFYIPPGFRYLQLALRHGSLTLPSAANPGITSGGLVGESKFETLRELFRTSPEFTAESWILPAGPANSRRENLRRIPVFAELPIPFILKPDVGQRGNGVRVIRNAEDADEYLKQTTASLVVQRYIPGPREAGIFYYRIPGRPHGEIFAITEKEFPVITGDGHKTLEELIWADDRARFMAHRYLERLQSRRNEILPPGKQLRLVEAGNHAQGCLFRDGSHLATPELAARIDAISRRLPGFFIGRYDVRYSHDDDLRAGLGFQVLELNGAAAEATHIYDARNSLWSAYRTLFRQWELVFEIGAANRSSGTLPDSPRRLWTLWRESARLAAGYPIAD